MMYGSNWSQALRSPTLRRGLLCAGFGPAFAGSRPNLGSWGPSWGPSGTYFGPFSDPLRIVCKEVGPNVTCPCPNHALFRKNPPKLYNGTVVSSRLATGTCGTTKRITIIRRSKLEEVQRTMRLPGRQRIACNNM